MNKHVAEHLLKKYIQGLCTEEEQAIIESWHLKELEGKVFKPEAGQLETAHHDIWQSISVKAAKKERSGRRILFRYAAAAVVFITLASGLFYIIQKKTSPHSAADLLVKTGKDFIPGSNKAILTLANGSRISLTDAANGKLAQQGMITITKTKDGQIIYHKGMQTAADENKQILLNTISTPRGGQYQVNLPDGSTVWLNSASSLKYPTVFNGHERKVELSGEAYFEVAKIEVRSASGKSRMPFIVKTASQEVKVLGTHFNINSYADEAATKTTLLEGSVNVLQLATGNSKLLKPGQQSWVSAEGTGPTVVTADVESEMAWKNGLFIFKDEDIESIMRKLSRWYDVDISFEGKPFNLSFVGFVSRSKNISSVLKIIEGTGNVNFKIEGRKIIVTN